MADRRISVRNVKDYSFMLLFLCGQDNFRSWQKLNEIIDHYKKTGKNRFNFRRFNKDNLNFLDFKTELEMNSMFKEKKFIILENVFSHKDFKEEFLKGKNKFLKSENIILFYESGGIRKNDSLFKFLKEKARFQEFKPLENEELFSWAKKEVLGLGAKIEESAIRKLIEFTGSDLWRVSNEIKKLINYKAGAEIERKDVENLVKPKIENDIFKTIDALTDKKKDKAIILIHHHLEEGDAPLYLLSMINFQFRNILEIKDLIEKNVPYHEMARKSGLHPFVVKKSFSQAQKFTIFRLKKIYRKMLQVDLSLKTGKIDPESAIDLLIASI
ncbi:DNA polymerase III subunit delta [Patescibacteria group bacterium]